jgi:ribose transport system ATP-binding protein
VVVMRDGLLVAREATASVTRRQMANLMVGRELADLFPPKLPAPQDGAPAIKVRGLTVPGWAEEVSFDVRRGEILGFAGLVGAGRTELFEGLLGLRPRTAGTVEIAGKPVQLRSPRDAARHGLTYLSEDRKGKGLHVHFGLRPNLTLMALERYAKPWLDPAAEQAALREAVQEFGRQARDLSPGAAPGRAGAGGGGDFV